MRATLWCCRSRRPTGRRCPARSKRPGRWRGGVDILVNNAGVSQRSLAIDTAPEVYRTLIETDLLAPIALTQAILPLMAARGSGHIVAISSVAGRVGPVLRTGYAAAKHGLIGYCDALRAEVETAYGIKVTTILPGSVRTRVAANALQGDGSARGVSDANIDAGMDPDECARRIVDAVAAGTRELIVAEGAEAFAAALRWQDPERLFDLLAAEGKRLAEARDEGRRPDPAPVRPDLRPDARPVRGGAGRRLSAGARRAAARPQAEPLDVVRLPADRRPRPQRDGAFLRHRVGGRGARLSRPSRARAAAARMRRGRPRPARSGARRRSSALSTR